MADPSDLTDNAGPNPGPPTVEFSLEAPRRVVLRAPRSAVRQVVGGTLLVVALLMSVPAVLLTLGLLLVVVDTADPKTTVDPSLVALYPTIVTGWFLSLLVAIVAGVNGLGLIRGNRRLVLFLRRFGFDEATGAVSYAIASSLGPAWRMVTLDDHHVAPIGITESARRVLDLADAGNATSRLARRGYRVGVVAVQLLVLATAAALVIDALGKPNFPTSLLESIGARAEVLVKTVQAGHLLKPPALDLDTAVLVLAAIFVLACLAIPVMLALALGLIVFSVPLMMFSGSLGSMRQAEAGKTQEISNPELLTARAWLIARQGRAIFAPRLTVLRVAQPMWREVVDEMAGMSSAILVDISEPTEALLWEIETLDREYGQRLLPIASYERMRQLAAGVGTESVLRTRLLAALDGRRVLAYTSDRKGLRRFSRSLRDRLETMPRVTIPTYPHPRRQAQPLRRR